MPPRKKKSPAADAALPAIPSELIGQIVKGPMSADAVNAASKALKKGPDRALPGGRALASSGLFLRR